MLFNKIASYSIPQIKHKHRRLSSADEPTQQLQQRILKIKKIDILTLKKFLKSLNIHGILIFEEIKVIQISHEVVQLDPPEADRHYTCCPW